jgi:uncharacterized protein
MDSYIKKEVHVFSVEGEKFLFEVETLRVYKIDHLIEKILDCGEEISLETVLSKFGREYPAEELTALFNALVEEQVLIKDGEDLNELNEAEMQAKVKNADLSNLVLNISQKCNMKCTYCYADGGAYNAPEQLMDKKTAEACVDFLLNASNVETCWIYFFGGEPLLNFDVLKHVVEYGKQRASIMGKELRFAITTNGTLLNEEIIKCFADNNFLVLLSLDGPKDFQDIQRPFKSGKGSYDVIKRHLEYLNSQEGVSLGCRCTVTPDNMDLQMIDEHFLDCGVKYYHIEPATFGPFTWGNEPGFEEVEMQKYLQQYGDLIKSTWNRVKDKKFVAYRPVFGEVLQLDRNERRIYPCGMGTSMFAVSAEGEVYACHRLVGMKEQVLGSVFDPGIKEAVKKYSPADIKEKEGCSVCWVRKYMRR